MKSVGEVMAIGRGFEEAMQKACRMLGVGAHGLVSARDHFEEENLEELLVVPTEERIFAIGEALRKGWSVDRIHQLTHITPWFIERVGEVVRCQQEIREFDLATLPEEQLRRAKELGFSDNQISRALRRETPIEPGYACFPKSAIVGKSWGFVRWSNRLIPWQRSIRQQTTFPLHDLQRQ